MRIPRYDINIANFLPHRPPMLMKCRTPYLDGVAVETHFEVTADNIFTNNNGYFSEPGLIELAAQTCSAITGQDFFDDSDTLGEGNKVVGYISAIKKVTIHGLAKIGETLVTKAKLVSKIQTGSMVMCTIDSATFINDHLIVVCTLNFLIHEIP